MFQGLLTYLITLDSIIKKGLKWTHQNSSLFRYTHNDSLDKAIWESIYRFLGLRAYSVYSSGDTLYADAAFPSGDESNHEHDGNVSGSGGL